MGCLPDDLVIDVRHVHDVLDVVAEIVGQDPPDDVKTHVCTSVAHMRHIVDGRSTDVPCNLVWIHWLEHIFFLGQGVLNSKYWLGVALYRRKDKRLESVWFGSILVLSRLCRTR